MRKEDHMESNLEVIHELYRSFKEKDYESFKKICDQNIIWSQSPGFPKGNSYKGAEEVVENVFKAFDDSWKEWTFTINKYHEAGDTIIVTGQYEGKHKITGKRFVSEAVHVYEVKDEKIVSFQQYADSKVIWDAME